MQIREAVPEDLPAMITLLDQLFSIEEDFTADRKRQRAGLQMILELESGVLLVTEHQGRVVGMISCQLVISSAEGGWSMLVEDLVIDQHMRGRGFGTALLSAAVSWGRKRRASRLQLLAERANHRGIAFYISRGLESTKLICLRKFIPA